MSVWPLRLKAAAAFDVFGVGANTDDHVCVVARPVGIDSKQPLRDYLRQPGGQVPTALVGLQGWGARTAYAGAFADDEGGRVQRGSLTDAGIDLNACVSRASTRSHTSVILVDRVSGARTVLWHAPATVTLHRDEIDRVPIEDTRIVLLDDSDLDAAVRLAARARAAGAVVVLDVDAPAPQVETLIALADVVIVSDGFPQRFTGSPLRPALATMARSGPALLIATLGAGGALAYAADELTFVPAVPVTVVDTTSAGDIFHAGVIHGMLQQWPLDETLRFASTAAALTCTALGGRRAIPSLSSIEQRLTQRHSRPLGVSAARS